MAEPIRAAIPANLAITMRAEFHTILNDLGLDYGEEFATAGALQYLMERAYAEGERAALARAEQATADARRVWQVCDDSGENSWCRNALCATLDRAKAYGIEAYLAEDPEVPAEQLDWQRRTTKDGEECWDLKFNGQWTYVEIWAVPVLGAEALAADVPAAPDEDTLVRNWYDAIETSGDTAASKDEHVWMAAYRRGLDYHHMEGGLATQTLCGRSTRTGYGMRLSEAVSKYDARPCPRCAPAPAAVVDPAGDNHTGGQA